MLVSINDGCNVIQMWWSPVLGCYCCSSTRGDSLKCGCDAVKLHDNIFSFIQVELTW